MAARWIHRRCKLALSDNIEGYPENRGVVMSGLNRNQQNCHVKVHFGVNWPRSTVTSQVLEIRNNRLVVTCAEWHHQARTTAKSQAKECLRQSTNIKL